MSNKVMLEFLSLYDYLGKAAGPELGKQVADYAKERKAQHRKRYVSNKKYAGEVLLYTKEFLDEYFEMQDTPSTYSLGF
jgi:hypothetical protein